MPERKQYSKPPFEYFDYKDVKTLSRYVDSYGKIESAHRSGLSANQQHQLATAIKRARHLALLPFVVK